MVDFLSFEATGSKSSASQASGLPLAFPLHIFEQFHADWRLHLSSPVCSYKTLSLFAVGESMKIISCYLSHYYLALSPGQTKHTAVD